MKYLLVNHIPARRSGKSDRIGLPRPWLDDLAAQSSALRQIGMRLIVATPLSDTLEDDVAFVAPSDVGFEHIEVPGYSTAREFLVTRHGLAGEFARLIDVADVVQFDHGGHPITPASLADPIAIARQKPRVWVFGDSDPFPRHDFVDHARNLARTVAKRIVGKHLHLRTEGFLRQAARSADLLIAHHASLQQTFSAEWGTHAHLIDRLDVNESDLIPGHDLTLRHARILDNARPIRFLCLPPLSAASGADQVLQAFQRIIKLRANARLILCGESVDLEPLLQAATSLNIRPAIEIFKPEQRDQAIQHADVLVDAALLTSAERPLARAIAAGLSPIAYRDLVSLAPMFGPGVKIILRGDINLLADAMLQAALDRTTLAARLLDGIAFVKQRTIDVSHHRRAELVARLIRHTSPNSTSHKPAHAR